MNRRQFLLSLMASATQAGWLQQAAAQQSWQELQGRDDLPPPRFLLVIELIGGNDHLNMLVPYRDAQYRRLRPNLAWPQERLLPISDELALPDFMRPLYDIFEKRELAIIQGVGHPEKADSHFRASGLWNTGVANDLFAEGWVASMLEAPHYQRDHVARGICIGENPAPLTGGDHMLTMDSLQQLLQEHFYGVRTQVAPHSVMLSHILQVEANLRRENRIPDNRFDNKPPPRFDHGFPQSKFGSDLQDVVAMITHGCAAPVMKVALNGFDTHTEQAERHPALLRELAQGIHAFREAILSNSFWSQVAVMVYSEFGRSAAENGQGGTEHGSTQPIMLVGRVVNGDIYGQTPDMAALANGRAEMQVDFRRIYNAMIHDWLGSRSTRISLREYPAYPVVDISFRVQERRFL